jgi:hypothetical protein
VIRQSAIRNATRANVSGLWQVERINPLRK